MQMQLLLTRDKSREMPPFENPDAVDGLRIWHCGYQTLAPVDKLRGLRTLVIATFPDASLDVLEPLSELRHLWIMHLPKVIDLAPLVRLRHLESLALQTLPSWDASRKLTEVHSLEPIGDLHQLRRVMLVGVVPRDRRLSPLERCAELKSARIRERDYPKGEVARLLAAMGVNDDPIDDRQLPLG